MRKKNTYNRLCRWTPHFLRSIWNNQIPNRVSHEGALCRSYRRPFSDPMVSTLTRLWCLHRESKMEVAERFVEIGNATSLQATRTQQIAPDSNKILPPNPRRFWKVVSCTFQPAYTVVYTDPKENFSQTSS